ncbi:MAG TPA: DNA polymerase/3'-5' exonuclease PolX [Planctomycetota bacterium]|nr:DNA polymerase/3'-5' exonuclease PolX [Planctomycetota bacterium]
MENASIARIFADMANICEIRGDNPFKIRAFRNAAAAIEALPFDVKPLCADPAKLREIKGIGDGMAKKIVELCETGRLDEHQKLLAEFPPTLLELLEIEGVGPKKVALFHEKLGVKTLADLEAAARAGKVRDLPRVGAKNEEKILRSIEAHKQRAGRFLYSWAERAVERLVEMLRALPGVRRVEPAGAFRRRRETGGDLDLLVLCDDKGPVMERFCKAGETIAHGDTKCSVKLSSGIQADLRVVPAESFGAAMHYFTGSKQHNIAIRSLALKRGLTVNEYGVFRLLEDGKTTGERVGGATEEEVFAAVGLPWIPPELREDRGEIEAAFAGRLPKLLEPGEIRGDVHMHTTETDGTASIEDMALAAAEQGRTYIAITDHSKALAFARGLDEARLREHVARIREADRKLAGKIRVLAGIEVDILEDGSLDLAKDALAALDVVVGSVHSHFGLGRDEMTARIVRAIESDSIDIVGHITGRILLRRDPYALDMERIMAAAKAHGVALEASAYPDRLDMSDVHCRMAKEHGVKVVIDTDSHATSHLELMRYGVANARRGWLEAGDVLNTRDCDDFLRLLHHGHR